MDEQGRADHDLLIEIKTTLGIVLARLDGFVTKSEIQPLIDQQEVCRAQFLNFVSQQEFRPVRNLVYGAIGLVLVSVVGAILALVINHN